jgi:hypothetical protein
VIEGLRLLHWWHEAIQRNAIGERSKCETCMEKLSEDQRQLVGCGYLPPIDEARQPFVMRRGPLGYVDDVTVCPGYSVNLPEVAEISRARLHWSKGSLRTFCTVNDALNEGIEILECAIGEVTDWRAQNPRKAGA